MKIKASCKMNQAAVKAMTYLDIYGTQKPRRRLLKRTALFLLLTALLGFQIYMLGWNLPFAIMLGILSILILLEYAWFFLAPRRRYRALGEKQEEETMYVFGADSVCIDENRTIAYSDFIQIMESDRYLFFYRTKRKIYPVDKSTFHGGTPEQLAKHLKTLCSKIYLICNY